MQVINEYRLNKRGSKVPAVIYLGNKWPTGKANPLTSRYLYLVLWLKWYTNHGEPRMIQHFPLLRPWSFSFILSPARMLDKCLEVCRGVFCCLFFVLFFFSFFFFGTKWYKRQYKIFVLLTITKKVGTSVSPHGAQSCSVSTSYSGIFPETTTVMRAATHLSIFKNKHAENKSMENRRGRKSKMRPRCTRRWFPPADWCGRAC